MCKHYGNSWESQGARTCLCKHVVSSWSIWDSMESSEKISHNQGGSIDSSVSIVLSLNTSIHIFAKAAQPVKFVCMYLQRKPAVRSGLGIRYWHHCKCRHIVDSISSWNANHQLATGNYLLLFSPLSSDSILLNILNGTIVHFLFCIGITSSRRLGEYNWARLSSKCLYEPKKPKVDA